MEAIINLSYFLAYVFPIKFIENIFKIQVDKLILIFIILAFIFFKIFLKAKIKISKIGFLFLMSILLRVIILRELEAINLVILLYVYENREKSFQKPNNTHVYMLGIILYSILYFGKNGRYAYTAAAEPNISGLYIFLIAVIFFYKKNYFFYPILILGIFTFSRNYLLCVIIFFLIEKNNIIKKLFLKIKNFNFIAYFSIMTLIFLGLFSEKMYREGKIEKWKPATFVERLKSPLDVSNYLRFNANLNVLKVYQLYPEKILTGIKEKEFIEINYIESRKNKLLYVGNKPHNFFFNYIRIYGFFSFFIFYILGKIFENRINEKSISFYIPIMIYAIFLGVGLNSYNLILVISAIDYINHKK